MIEEIKKLMLRLAKVVSKGEMNRREHATAAGKKEKQQQSLSGVGGKKRKLIAQAATHANDEIQEIPGGWSVTQRTAPVVDDDLAAAAHKSGKKLAGAR